MLGRGPRDIGSAEGSEVGASGASQGAFELSPGGVPVALGRGDELLGFVAFDLGGFDVPASLLPPRYGNGQVFTCLRHRGQIVVLAL